MGDFQLAKRFGLSQSQSCYELQQRPEIWMGKIARLIERWDDEHSNPTPSADRKPDSPFHRRKHMSVAVIIKQLRNGLPFIRTDELQRQLSALFDLIAAFTTHDEFLLLDSMINTQRVIIDPVAIKLRRGLPRDDILKIDYGAWKPEHMRFALVDLKTGEFRPHALSLSRKLTRKWMCLEPLDAPLREESPLKWLITFWVTRLLVTELWERVEEILRSVLEISGDLLTFLRYQSRQLARLGFESRDVTGSHILHVIYFSCCLPAITPKSLQIRLLSDFVKLRVTILRKYEEARIHLGAQE
jgi:hypothetical protein